MRNELFYHIREQLSRGASVTFTEQTAYGMSHLLQSLGLTDITITRPVLSELSGDRFTLSGRFQEESHWYTCTLQSDSSVTYIYQFEAELETTGDMQLLDLYTLPQARTADTFYNLVDVYTHITVIHARITATSEDKKARLHLTLDFDDKSLLIYRYGWCMPGPHEPVLFSGEAEYPFSKARVRFTLRASYIKEGVELPMINGLLPVRQCRLTIVSHEPDGLNLRANAGEAFISSVYWAGQIPVRIGTMEGIELEFRIFDHAQYFTLGARLGRKGLSMQDIFLLIAELTGKDQAYDLPDWLATDNLTLQSLLFQMQKEMTAQPIWNAESSLTGVGVEVGLTLPTLPIPFFDTITGNGAEILLYFQWDMLNRGGIWKVLVGFRSRWKDYVLTVNIEIPNLYFQGRLYLDSTDTRHYSIFPGFTNLAVKNIFLCGSLKDNTYSMNVLLENNQASKLPIGNAVFDILYIEGNAYYSPEGLGLGIRLAFQLLSASIEVSGSYDRTAGSNLLTLQGMLLQPLNLVELINRIFDTDYTQIDLVLRELKLMYKIELGEKNTVETGTVDEFQFIGKMDFEWKAISLKTTTEADIKYIQKKWNLYLKVSFEWMKFLMSGSCRLRTNSKNGELVFTDAEFLIRFMDMSVRALAHDSILRIELRNINLGKLIEELINTIVPDVNWYLPWPFKILKQFTLKAFDIELDDKKQTLKLSYPVNIDILFFTIKSIDLKYDGKAADGESFTLNIPIEGILTTDGEDEQADNNSLYPYMLDFIKDRVYPSIPGLDRLVKLKYLALGQHIGVSIPNRFDENSIDSIISELQNTISKEGIPVDPDNNWIVVLQTTILESIQLDLLLCDPGFYGLRVQIGGGSSATEAFEGLKFYILYAKVTETVGVFQAKLSLPEKYRRIQTGVVDICLGDVLIAIYTDGHFKIDLGFPHNGDFSQSFAVTVEIFIGRGGLYLAVLDGDTSDKVPKVRSGHFCFVLEAGIGLAIGVGKEFSAGVVKVAAYVQVLGILEGVFAVYENVCSETSNYYRLSAMVGIVAHGSLEVDFFVIRVSAGIEASAMVWMVMESYRKTDFHITLNLKVYAHIKILFIRINFSFSFSWKMEFSLGRNTVAPWERTLPLWLQERAVPMVSIHWTNDALFVAPLEMTAFAAPYFSLDGISPDGQGGTCKTAFLLLLTGYQSDTFNYLSVADTVEDSSVACLVRAFLKRVLVSAFPEGDISQEELGELSSVLAREELDEGFSLASIHTFLENNVRVRLLKGTLEELPREVEIHSVPMPMPPLLKLFWQMPGRETETRDLSTEPAVTSHLLEEIDAYYRDLHIERKSGYRMFREGTESASALFFRDYCRMVTKAAVSVLADNVNAAQTYSVDQLMAWAVDPALLDRVSGMVSRFTLGGTRVPVDKRLISLYEFSGQQFTSLRPASTEIHTFGMELTRTGSWLALQQDALASDIFSRNLVLDQGLATERLEWHLSAADMKYPTGNLPAVDIEIAPYFEQVSRTLTPRTPRKIAMEAKTFGTVPLQQFYACPRLPDICRVRLYKRPDEYKDVSFCRGHLLDIPFTRITPDVYAIQPIGYENMRRLYAIREDVKEIAVYRSVNPLDNAYEPDSELESAKIAEGLLPIAYGVCLYRTNLSLETEKPEITGTKDNVPRHAEINSADMATEAGVFIRLLKDAALVNSKGYYIRFYMPEEHRLTDERYYIPDHAHEDNDITLSFWIECDTDAESILLDAPAADETVMIITPEYEYIPRYEPGQLEFIWNSGPPANELQQTFQMLGYRIGETSNFSESHYSMPLIANDQYTYAQVVPAHRMARGGGKNPYAAIRAGSLLKLEFLFLDVLGNKSAIVKEWQGMFGYTDPIFTPASYPHTQCNFYIQQTEDEICFTVLFRYKKQEGEAALMKAQAGTAYFQLLQTDMKMEVEVLGVRETLNKEPLLDYLRQLYEAEMAGEASYVISRKKPEGFCTRIHMMLYLTRDEDLLAPELKNKPEYSPVHTARYTIEPDNQEAKNNADKQSATLISNDYENIARDAESGLWYYIRYPQVSQSTPVEYWGLKPLGTQLITLKDIELEDKDGVLSRVSFTHIDLEEWADIFLRDFEDYMAPESPHKDDVGVLESLLKIKQELAEKIARGAMPVTKVSPLYGARAEECFRELMLRNLYEGRKTDAIAILDSQVEAPPLYHLTGNVRTRETDDRVTVTAQKVKEDRLLPFVVKSRNISENNRVSLDLIYVPADWEWVRENRPAYLTYLAPQEYPVRLDIPLPYKRYPSPPVLTGHGYSFVPDDPSACFSWNYQMEFSHAYAAQDTIYMNLILGEYEYKKGGSRKPLAEALAQYMYVRDQVLSGEISSGHFIKMAEEIAASWENPVNEKVSRNNLSYFWLEREGNTYKRLVYHASNPLLRTPAIYLSGIPLVASGQTEQVTLYEIPENDWTSPFSFRFVFEGLDIREKEHRSIMTEMCVSRNQNIPDIREEYIYTTPWMRYYESLLPAIQCTATIHCGPFIHDNFHRVIQEYTRSFEQFSLECSCGVPLVKEGGEKLYASIPVLLIPDMSGKSITDVFDRLVSWLYQHIKDPERVIDCYLTNYDTDQHRPVVEITTLRFAPFI